MKIIITGHIFLSNYDYQGFWNNKVNICMNLSSLGRKFKLKFELLQNFGL
jgi:hypothetical protein